MKLNGAEITIKLLERQGIDMIAGIPGGANLPLYDALSSSKIKHILARHEQAAGFIAQGITRTTGKPAVCFATSGPGVANLLTAIADAKLDSIPIVAISGQVSYSLMGTDAFQEVDTYGLTIPITKHNFLVRTVEELFEVIPDAFRIAQEGRPGPVLVDIPKDVQLKELEFHEWPEKGVPDESLGKNIPEKYVLEVAKMINESKRPLMYIGGGVVHSDTYETVREFARKNNIPVTSTLMGLGCVADDDPLFLGMVGMHGSRYTNYLLKETDLLLAFGVRFDDRATGKAVEFCKDATIIHIDIDEAEINKIKKADIYLNGDIGYVLKQMLPKINKNDRKEWIATIEKMKKEFPFYVERTGERKHPIEIIREIASLAPDDTIIATDVGQHQMWVAQAYPFKFPRTLLTSGGLGTMGFGLPTAIGAALANPDKTVLCFSGDGSILMNIQELATLADLELNVKVIILNNEHLGLVRQQQEMFYNQHYFASKFIKNPDFAAISKGFGVAGYNITEKDDTMEIFKKMMAEKGPCVINVPIQQTENVVPIVPPGAANDVMVGGEYGE